jgi:hypothetical protein
MDPDPRRLVSEKPLEAATQFLRTRIIGSPISEKRVISDARWIRAKESTGAAICLAFPFPVSLSPCYLSLNNALAGLLGLPPSLVIVMLWQAPISLGVFQFWMFFVAEPTNTMDGPMSSTEMLESKVVLASRLRETFRSTERKNNPPANLRFVATVPAGEGENTVELVGIP